MNTSTTQPAKPSFYNICTIHKLNSQKLQKIATTSGVPVSTIEAMCNGAAVTRSDAEKVLAAFSQFTQSHWTLNNVNVLVLPTFADLYEVYEFDTTDLSVQSGIPLVIVDQMLCDEKVAKDAAVKVLQTLSSQTGHNYSLDTVVVQLSDGQVHHD